MKLYLSFDEEIVELFIQKVSPKNLADYMCKNNTGFEIYEFDTSAEADAFLQGVERTYIGFEPIALLREDSPSDKKYIDDMFKAFEKVRS